MSISVTAKTWGTLQSCLELISSSLIDISVRQMHSGIRLRPFYFLEMRTNLEMEPRTVNRVFSSIRVFFNFLLRREYVRENPLQDIPPLRENSIIPFVFSPEQTDQVLRVLSQRVGRSEKNFLTDLALYLAVLLLARCGMRISEPLKLMNNHYRSDDGTLYIEKTKFKKQRLIPVPQGCHDRNRKLPLSA